MLNLPRTLEEFNAFGSGHLPALLGFEVLSVEPGKLRARMKIRPDLLAPNGYLHAASVVALADTACGYGTITLLPPEATGFTTIELKSNFLGTCREGAILADGVCIHSGRTTQVWDASVTDESNGKRIAVFRCTQVILYKA
ncbi:MAG: PaaI family thioesterase [Bryobacteraceae bacterium]